jgi:hypothetical protein
MYLYFINTCTTFISNIFLYAEDITKYEQKAVALCNIAVNEHRNKNGARKERNTFGERPAYLAVLF